MYEIMMSRRHPARVQQEIQGTRERDAPAHNQISSPCQERVSECVKRNTQMSVVRLQRFKAKLEHKSVQNR